MRYELREIERRKTESREKVRQERGIRYQSPKEIATLQEQAVRKPSDHPTSPNT
jgi:hypothetical protein